MKKVLFVATVTLHINAFHIPYLKMFKEKGYEVHVASSGNEKIEYCDKHYNLPFERFPLKWNNYKTYKELKKIIKENNYEIIHCHTPVGGLLTRLAARKFRKNGTKVFYTAHGFELFIGAPIKNWIVFFPVEWFLAKYTDTLITINKEDYELAQRKFNKRCKNIKYVHGVGIDREKFDIKITDMEKKVLKDSIGLKENDFVLTCIARLDKNKNQIFLLKVIEELVKDYCNIHLLLAGKDELNGYYQSIAKKMKIDSNVHFLGNRNDIPKLLKITDIVLSASKREGLPVNVMEAFASRVPVVALRCRGMEDLIVENKNGFIVNSKIEFINSIKKIYYVNIILDENSILDKFELESIKQEMKKIYLENM